MLMRPALAVSLPLLLLAGRPTLAGAAECDSPRPGWLACEDFEDGGLGWPAWFAQSPFVECLGCSNGDQNPTRILLTNGAGEAFEGDWAVYMPAAASASYQGAALVWRDCAGDKRPGCTLNGHDQLYFRAYVRLAPDHQQVHHFLSVAGTQPDRYWDSDGNAGCRPNGERAAGTTVDFNTAHELFFYTYYPEMHCDSGGYCSGSYAQQICDGCATKDMPCLDGLECCWGNLFKPDPPVVLARGQWVCLEMMMRINTPGQADGEMAFWVDGALAHRQTGMHWRDVSALQLNKANLQHYLDVGDADQPNRVWFDNVVVSTSPIGCLGAAPPASDAGPAAGADAAPPVPGQPDARPGADAPGGAADAADASAAGEVSGCACRASGRRGAWTGLLPATLGLLGLAIARRRRGRG